MPSSEDDWECNEESAVANPHAVLAKNLSIEELTCRANGYHAAVLEGVRTTLTAAKDCGAVLANIKLRLPHGEWGAWLKENFAASEYTAQRYMRISRDWHILQQVVDVDGPELPGIKRADELLRTFHQELPTTVGGKNIPPPPPGHSQERVKSITGNLAKYVKHWPDYAIDYLDAEMDVVIDSIEVYVQEELGEVNYPEVLPRIAIREKATEIKLMRAFVKHMGELTEGEQVKLLEQFGKPGALRVG